MSVSAAGDSAFTLMPKRASSIASVSVSPTIPPFAAAYAENPGVPWVPAPDVTLTIRPHPACFIPGTSSRMRCIGPVRFTARLRFHSSSVSRVIAAAGRQAGVVHEHVDGADLVLPRRRHSARTASRSATSAAMPIAFGSSAATTARRRPRLRPCTIDARALRGEPLGDRTTDAAGGTGDERDVTGEQVHDVEPQTFTCTTSSTTCVSKTMRSCAKPSPSAGCTHSPVLTL